MKLLDRIINTKKADPESLLAAALIVSCFMDRDFTFVESGGMLFCLEYLGGAEYLNYIITDFEEICNTVKDIEDE